MILLSILLHIRLLIKAVSSLQYEMHLRQTSSSPSVIASELDVKKNLWFVPIKIGSGSQDQNQGQSFNVLYDTGSFHLWIGNNTLESKLPRVYEKTKSTSYEETTNEIITTHQFGNEALDYIYLGDMSNNDNAQTPNKKMSFVLLNQLEIHKAFEGVLGLARGYPGKIKYSNSKWVEAQPRFSYIDYLYLTEQISHKVFAHKFTSKNKATLYIGDTGVRDTKSYHSCSINQELNSSRLYHLWHCTSNALLTEQGTEIVNQSFIVVFDSSRDDILVPSVIGEKLFAYINDITDGLYCTKRTPRNGAVLYCNQDFPLGILPNVQLNLIEFKVTLKLKDLFKLVYEEGDSQSYYGYESRIVASEKMSYILLGTPFMKYYHMIFDMDTGNVTFGDYIDVFLDKETRERLKMNSGNWGLIRIALVIGVVIAGLVLLIFLIRKLLRNKKRKLNAIMKKTIIEKEILPIGQPLLATKST